MNQQVLQLDAAGTPQEWIDPKVAAQLLAIGKVLWHVGDPFRTFRGGMNSVTGRMSTIEIPPIIARHGDTYSSKNYKVHAVTSDRLFLRDRLTCGYCAQRFKVSDLTVEHIIPESRGGPYTWMNLVSACRRCNSVKACRTPEEARMPLAYLPYAPSLHEGFILSQKTIIADQMSFLMSGVPSNSRLRS